VLLRGRDHGLDVDGVADKAARRRADQHLARRGRLLQPRSDVERIAGRDAVADPAGVRREVGIIFQKPSLDLNLSGEENVRFHALLYGLYPYRPLFRLMPRSYREEVRELAAVLGLEKEIFKPVKALSGGMKRKLEIVRSLMHEPKVLFLDEPTAGLDADSRRSLWEYLRQIRGRTGATVFLTTHYLEEAEEADTICIIEGGKIVSFGTPADIKRDLVDEYLLVVPADADALRRELDAMGVAYSAGREFKLSLNGGSVHSVLKAIETPLLSVKTHLPSLEDAYIAVLKQSDPAG
jgi:ABC-2 type transport system ATP-binding protein